MAWIAEERRTARVERGEPLLTESLRKHLEDTYFLRYPTKRAVLLPALHAVQHEYGWIPPQAMEEIADFLSISSAEVLDTASFYEEYWLKPKGKYLVAVCRSLSCEVCGHANLTQRVMEKCNVEVGETSDDGRFTLVELECLGSCGTAPVALINDVLHEELTPEKLEQLIDGLPEDPHDYNDPTVTWAAGHGHVEAGHGTSGAGHTDAEHEVALEAARRPEAAADHPATSGATGPREDTPTPRGAQPGTPDA